MPILLVYGVKVDRSGDDQVKLKRAVDHLQAAIASELEVEPEKVEVYFVRDLWEGRMADNKIISFLKTFKPFGQTEDVLKRTADRVTEVLLEDFGLVNVAECHPEFLVRGFSSVCIRSSHIPPPDC